jgi:hypothetical protein
VGKIVIHAGMGKTGSSSIKRWLREHGATLREAGIAPLRASVGSSAEVKFAPGDDRQGMNSNAVWQRYQYRPADRPRIAATLLEGLDREASSRGAIVVSSEAFHQWLWRRGEPFVAALDDLASSHEVELAYYVRPQHTALEAAWRQWGFWREAGPSRFLHVRCNQVDYLSTLRLVREAAPRVRFAPRPFRRDLLAGGNVVVDFARNFCGIEVEADDDPTLWENRGLPLELVNALHGAPTGLLWPSDAARDVKPSRKHLRALADGLELPQSNEVRLSRLVLQQACHERFESDNRKLISELGWETDEWVPAVDSEVGEASFERLDELWRPRASAAELALLRGAVARLLDAARSEHRAKGGR